MCNCDNFIQLSNTNYICMCSILILNYWEGSHCFSFVSVLLFLTVHLLVFRQRGIQSSTCDSVKNTYLWYFFLRTTNIAFQDQCCTAVYNRKSLCTWPCAETVHHWLCSWQSSLGTKSKYLLVKSQKHGHEDKSFAFVLADIKMIVFVHISSVCCRCGRGGSFTAWETKGQTYPSVFWSWQHSINVDAIHTQAGL